MSELIDIHSGNASMRTRLLAAVSALALTAYVSSTTGADAETGEHPTVWIVLGGQLETMQGTDNSFSAPFMFPDTTPDVYGEQTFARKQKAPRFALGGEGEIKVQPNGSDWVFSAAVRFGRANSKKHTHYQGPQAFYTSSFGFRANKYAAPFSDTLAQHSESHAIVDFSAGRDIGVGLLGREGGFTLNMGVRFAQLSQKASVDIHARPVVNVVPSAYYFGGNPSFHQYTLFGQDERSFHGIGPSISLNGSTVLLGSKEDGDLAVDWGVNGAVLFGRQKAKVSHTTQEYFLPPSYYASRHYSKLYEHEIHNTRSRSVVIPNLGGFAGISMRKANAKVSLGYRADFFFGAMDTGIDERRTSDLGFHGPFATISIGLGG